MTDQIREQISALLDGELTRDELGLLVRRMERDAELRRAFGNYVLMGETLSAPGGRTASLGFAARVSAAIDDQPAAVADVTEARHSLRVHWTRPVVATAVAASAAVAVVLVWRPDAPDAGPAARADAGQGTELPLPASSSPTLEQSQRLASYLVTHSQFSSPIGRRNVLMGVLAEDPGIERVAYESYESIEAP
jgi:sigma-E factor negative regulatory protein RseA